MLENLNEPVAITNLALAAPMVLAIGLLILRRPEGGLAALFCLPYLDSIYAKRFTLHFLVLSATLVAILYCLMLKRENRESFARLFHSLIFYTILVFTAYFVLNYIFLGHEAARGPAASGEGGRAIVVNYLSIVFMPTMLLFLLPGTPESLRRFFSAFIILGSLTALLVLVNHGIHGMRPVFGADKGIFFVSVVLLSNAAANACIIAVGLTGLQKSRVTKVLFACSAGLSAAVVLIYGRRSILAALCLTGAYLILMRTRLSIFKRAFLLGFLLLALITGGLFTAAGSRFFQLHTTKDIDDRLVLQKRAFHTVMQYPLFGVGVGNFGKTLYGEGPSGERVAWKESVHNVLLGALAETGIAGCLLFVCMLIVPIAYYIKILRLPSRNLELSRFADVAFCAYLISFIRQYFNSRGASDAVDLMWPIVLMPLIWKMIQSSTIRKMEPF